MITTIDNNQRVFLIERLGFSTRKYFCNLKDIPTILNQEIEKNDDFVILEYWNHRLKKVTKTRLNQMFEANQIDFKI